MQPPVVTIDPQQFWLNPYPTLKKMREQTPICHVPQLNATLFTRREDIVICEKNVDVFSSSQPGGLMTELMGENMMRKDGEPHRTERRQALPALSPKTVKQVWLDYFARATDQVLDDLAKKESCNLVTDYAMPVSAHALRHITGLVNMSPTQMDATSQAMIDGIANYTGDSAIEARCHHATALIDQCIDEMIATPAADCPELSLLQVLRAGNQPMESIRANIKLAISGGQNEPRDAIAGTAWAMLTHPKHFTGLKRGDFGWRQVFEEYARWISPIGMSPRRVAKPFNWQGILLEPESRVFFMFGSGNRDEAAFTNPDEFSPSRDNSNAISFGAGPHFCAGASASRALIADVALPKLFERFPKLALAGEVPFGGWAFRGPLSMPVHLK